MGPVHRHPAVDAWMTDEFGEASSVVLAIEQLPGLVLASQRQLPRAVPEEVLQAWQYLLVSERIKVAQSEAAFIDAARAGGWPDAKIAEHLQLGAPDVVDRHQAGLRAEVERLARGIGVK